MIITSVWGSLKFRSLADDSCRLGYLFLHTNAHGNSIGAYRMPIEYLMADMDKSKDEAARIVDEIVDAGLAQYDGAENSIRIMNWFPHNPINSPKHLAGALSRFADIPKKSNFVPDVAAEIIVSAHGKARELALRGRSQLSNSKTERAKTSGMINVESSSTMIQALSEMMEGLSNAQQNRVIAALDTYPSRLVRPIAEDLNLPLSGAEFRVMDTPIDTPIGSPKRTETETETHTHTETETQTETQSEVSKHPKIQDDIAELNARAKKG